MVHDSASRAVSAYGNWQRYDRSAITKIWTDQGYTGDLEEIVNDVVAIGFEIVKKDSQAKGCVLLPQRWVVDRTFAWLGRARALSNDDEHRVEYRETIIYLASIHVMVKRLRPNTAKTVCTQYERTRTASTTRTTDNVINVPNTF